MLFPKWKVLGISPHPCLGQFNQTVYLSVSLLLFHVSDFCDPEKICSLWLDDLLSDKEFSGASGGSPVFPFPRCLNTQQEASGVPLERIEKSPRELWDSVITIEKAHSAGG